MVVVHGHVCHYGCFLSSILYAIQIIARQILCSPSLFMFITYYLMLERPLSARKIHHHSSSWSSRFFILRLQRCIVELSPQKKENSYTSAVVNKTTNSPIAGYLLHKADLFVETCFGHV